MSEESNGLNVIAYVLVANVTRLSPGEKLRIIQSTVAQTCPIYELLHAQRAGGEMVRVARAGSEMVRESSVWMRLRLVPVPAQEQIFARRGGGGRLPRRVALCPLHPRLRPAHRRGGAQVKTAPAGATGAML